MGRLRVLSGEQVCEILTSEGFTRVRKRGSHIIMRRQSAEGKTTIPVPDHDPVRRGTLRAIIRQSGLPRERFEH